MTRMGIVLGYCVVAALGCSDDTSDPASVMSNVAGAANAPATAGATGSAAAGSGGSAGIGGANAAAGIANAGGAAGTNSQAGQGGATAGTAGAAQAGTAGAPAAGSGGAAPLAGPFALLIFSKVTMGYRHESIEAGIELITQLGVDHDFTVTATEDSTQFTDETLAQYAVVVFLNSKGDVLDETQQGAFQRFIQAGHGYVGVHTASYTEETWPWYGELVGAYFMDHPAIQPVTIHIEDHNHPSTATLPDEWTRTEEPYNFVTNPRANVTVLATLDEASYTGGTMGADHPITWYHEFDGGRAWYTGLGHTIEGYSEDLFITHLLGGIEWAAGRK